MPEREKVFDKALAFCILWEGGERYTNDPADPGGETKWGISKRSHPNIDIKGLTYSQARDIYYNEYWIGAGCDELDPKRAWATFDTAVNLGVKRALALRTPTSTWHSIINARRDYYYILAERRPSLQKFLRGWLRRVDALEDELMRYTEEEENDDQG